MELFSDEPKVYVVYFKRNLSEKSKQSLIDYYKKQIEDLNLGIKLIFADEDVSFVRLS